MMIDVPEKMKLALLHDPNDTPIFYLQNMNLIKGRLTRLIYVLEPEKTFPMSKLQEYKYFAEGQFRDVRLEGMVSEVAILKSGVTPPPAFSDTVNVKRTVEAGLAISKPEIKDYMREALSYQMSMNVDSVVKDIIGVPQRADALVLVFTSTEVGRWMP